MCRTVRCLANSSTGTASALFNFSTIHQRLWYCFVPDIVIHFVNYLQNAWFEWNDARKKYRQNFDEALHFKKMIYMQFIQIHDLKFPLLKQWTRAQQKRLKALYVRFISSQPFCHSTGRACSGSKRFDPDQRSAWIFHKFRNQWLGEFMESQPRWHSKSFSWNP